MNNYGLEMAPPNVIIPDVVPTNPSMQPADLGQQIKPFYIDGAAGRQSYEIGFLAKSVVITNLTGGWWYCSTLDFHIPPLCWGIVRNLPHGAQQFTLVPESPGGAAGNGGSAGQTLTLIFFAVAQPPVAGSLISAIQAPVVSGTSAANAPQTVTTPTGTRRRVKFVTIHYSAAVNVTATLTLVSALGAGFNTILYSIVLAGASDALLFPDGNLDIAAGDSLSLLAPAGGVGITSSVVIYTDILA